MALYLTRFLYFEEGHPALGGVNGKLTTPNGSDPAKPTEVGGKGIGGRLTIDKRLRQERKHISF